MLQDGIAYFGMVVVLNASMIISFSTDVCPRQLIFQRITQVLTVVMISHMFLNLKRSSPPAQEDYESYIITFGSLMETDKAYQTSVSLDAWPKTMSSVIGTLGNDLALSSISDTDSSQEKVTDHPSRDI